MFTMNVNLHVVPPRNPTSTSATVRTVTHDFVSAGTCRKWCGTLYLWCRESGEWSYLYGHLMSRSLADRAGTKNASVNFVAALSPFYHYLFQFAPPVPRSRLDWTVSLDGTRLQVTLLPGTACRPHRWARIKLRPMEPVLDRRNVTDAVPDMGLAFPFKSLPTGKFARFSQAVSVDNLRRPASFAASLFRVRPGHQWMLNLWELGTMLAESPVRPRCSFYYGPGGTGKSHTVETVFGSVLGRLLLCPLAVDYWCSTLPGPTEEDILVLQCSHGVYIPDSAVGTICPGGGTHYSPAVPKRVTGGDAFPDPASGSVRVEIPLVTICNALPDHEEHPAACDEPMLRRSLVSFWYRSDVMRETIDFSAPDPDDADVAELVTLSLAILRTYRNSPPISGWDLLLSMYGTAVEKLTGIRVAVDPELDDYAPDDELEGEYGAVVAIATVMRTTEEAVLERARCISSYAVVPARDYPRLYALRAVHLCVRRSWIPPWVAARRRRKQLEDSAVVAGTGHELWDWE